jgi:hypothetical protein
MPEYGIPLPGVAWAVGHWVWLRVATGPVLARVLGVSALGGRVDVLLQDADPEWGTMTVPRERLAWSYSEAVTA